MAAAGTKTVVAFSGAGGGLSAVRGNDDEEARTGRETGPANSAGL